MLDRPATDRPARGGLERFETLGKALYRRLPLGSSQRWAAKRAFYKLFGRYLAHTESHAAFRLEQRWRERSHAVDVSRGPGPPAAAEGRPDVIVLGTIDWHFRMQRPQQLARELARAGQRVFYVSQLFLDRAGPGFHAERVDARLPLYSLRLHASPPPAIHSEPPRGATLEQIQASLQQALAWAGARGAWCVLDHPAWIGVGRATPHEVLVYDCMDHHARLNPWGPGMEACERATLREAQLVVTTSAWLSEHVRALGAEPLLLRNACDPTHFDSVPRDAFRDRAGRQVIGYVGSLTSWVDIELLRGLSHAFPDCLLRLVGFDSTSARGLLARLPNVEVVGEVPYAELPRWLHGMDVCTIPFLVNELTRATNPVKLYEYLAAGKPVVTTDLPELAEPGLERLVRRAASHADFVEAVRESLAEAPGDPLREERRRFARGQSWVERARALREAIGALRSAPSSCGASEPSCRSAPPS